MTSISKCEKTFCKKYVERSNKRANKWNIKAYEKEVPKMIEDYNKQLAKSDLEDEKRSELKKDKKFFEKSMKNWKNKTMRKKTEKKMGRMTFANCKERYCNPECKHTSFENGKEISESYRKAIRKISKTMRKGKKNKVVNRWFSKKNMIKEHEDFFREVHGNRENVLQDGFYEELPKKVVEKMRKKGAISGCIKDVKLDANLG
jgi:hypothetical protein